jgi:hypothetical protein
MVNLPLLLINYHAMNMYGRAEIYLYTFLTSVLDWGRWSASSSIHFIPEEKAPDIYRTGGCVDPRGIPSVVEKRKFFCHNLELNPISLADQPNI